MLPAAYESDVISLSSFRIPRWMGVKPGDDLELHIFADSSKLAIGACAYLVTPEMEEVRSVLITSRSKVAALKKTIPRLKLSAAVIAARLSEFIKKVFGIENTADLKFVERPQKKCGIQMIGGKAQLGLNLLIMNGQNRIIDPEVSPTLPLQRHVYYRKMGKM